MVQKDFGTIRISRRRALAGAGTTAVALAMIGASSTVAWAASGESIGATGLIGYLYVNGNTPGANTVVGFARKADGTLSMLPGSPFSVGGVGSGTALGSQGALQLSADRRFLLAVDGGSNQISVLRIQSDGSLSPVAGSPFPSNGIKPVSIAVHGNLVYVANAGPGGSNYTGFTIRTDGVLQPIAGSTVSLPDDSGVGDVLIDPFGRYLIGIRVNTSLIDSFTIGSGGLLAAAPGSPIAAQAAGPFGSVFRVSNPPQLFVSNAHAGAGNGSVSAYTVAVDGTLQAIGTSPYPDQQTAPCWVALEPDMRYLFAANAGSDSISSYSVAADGTLSLVGSTALRDGPGLGTFDLGLDPAGRYPYQVDGNKREINALAVTGGSLSEIASSPISLGLSANAVPSGVAII